MGIMNSPISSRAETARYIIDDQLHNAGVTDIPLGYPGLQTPREKQCLHDGSKAVRMLGLNMTSRSKMVCDTAASLRERFGH